MWSWPRTWQRSPGSLRVGQGFLEANKSHEQLPSGIWRTQNLTLRKEYSGSQCPHAQPGPGGGEGSTPSSVPVCGPQGVTGGPSGRQQPPPRLLDVTSRTRRCPGPCTLRALLARARKVPGGSQLSPALAEVAHPQVGGHFQEQVWHGSKATPAILALRRNRARPCLGHQGAPGPRSATRLPGSPLSPCAR